MRAVLVVIADIFVQQPSQMPRIERDHVIEQVSSHTAHPTFGHPILPWTAECGAQWLAAHSLYRRSDIDTKLGIAVEEQEALRLLALLPGLAQLQRNPNRLWTTSHVAVQDSAPVVGHHEEAIQNAKGEGRDGEEVQYHEDRTHLGLEKETPARRVRAKVSPTEAQVTSLPRLGGLHHRYTVAA